MKSRFFVITFLLYVLLMSSMTQGYGTLGVERGDIVNLDYELRVDGSNHETGNIPDAKIDSDGGLIEGFWKGVIGAKLDTYKTITVQPGDGYTQSGHELYGKVLVFTVFVKKIIFDSSEDDDAGSSGDGTFSKVFNVAKWIGGIGLIFLVLFAFSNRKTFTVDKCVHCKTMGRDTLSEGTCSKCGTNYCRSSFSRGCPNCKGNSFLPYAK